MAKGATSTLKAETFLPISNLNYDLLTILQNKLEAIAAYETYLHDCEQAGEAECHQLVDELKRDDERHVEFLRAELERIVKEGKFH